MQENEPVFPSLEQGLRPLEKLMQQTLLPPESPYSRERVLLAEAMEAFSAHELLHTLPCLASQEERRDAALLRRVETQQRALLIPYSLPEETDCGHALLLSALAMELTAVLAQCMREGSLRQLLHFLLPEFLDECYRLSNMMLLLGQGPAQELLAGYTEIMPGRPLIACHRHPYDEICFPLVSDDPLESMTPILLCAVLDAQQRFFLHAAERTGDALARALYLELSWIAASHHGQVFSMLPSRKPLETLFFTQYAEAYIYDSLAKDEELPFLRQFFLEERENEMAHLKKITRCMEKSGAPLPILAADPPRLRLGPNKGYIRDVLQNVGITALRERLTPVGELPNGADFFRYQQRVCPHPREIPSHLAVARVIEAYGEDYRFEIAPHPIELLRDRRQDHTEIGR